MWKFGCGALRVGGPPQVSGSTCELVIHSKVHEVKDCSAPRQRKTCRVSSPLSHVFLLPLLLAVGHKESFVKRSFLYSLCSVEVYKTVK